MLSVIVNDGQINCYGTWQFDLLSTHLRLHMQAGDLLSGLRDQNRTTNNRSRYRQDNPIKK